MGGGGGGRALEASGREGETRARVLGPDLERRDVIELGLLAEEELGAERERGRHGGRGLAHLEEQLRHEAAVARGELEEA